MVHVDQKLVLGPLSAGRYLADGSSVTETEKGPGTRTIIWNVNEAVEVQFEMPPVDTKAETSHVAVKGSGLSFSIDGGARQEGAPTTLGPLSAGEHTLRVWAGKEPAPLISSWVQEETPAFGRMQVSVTVTNRVGTIYML